jgi:hypothetical protein
MPPPPPPTPEYIRLCVATSTALHDLEVDYRGVELSNLHVTLHDTLRATLVSVRGGIGMGGE